MWMDALLDRITSEACCILRRSAGLPCCVLALVRAESGIVEGDLVVVRKEQMIGEAAETEGGEHQHDGDIDRQCIATFFLGKYRGGHGGGLGLIG